MPFLPMLSDLVGSEEEMMDEEAEEKVDPARDAGDADAEDEAKDVMEIRFLDESGDTDDDLNDPVDARDEEKDDLN
jgi:hypothetical protein